MAWLRPKSSNGRSTTCSGALRFCSSSPCAVWLPSGFDSQLRVLVARRQRPGWSRHKHHQLPYPAGRPGNLRADIEWPILARYVQRWRLRASQNRAHLSDAASSQLQEVSGHESCLSGAQSGEHTAHHTGRRGTVLTPSGSARMRSYTGHRRAASHDQASGLPGFYVPTQDAIHDSGVSPLRVAAPPLIPEPFDEGCVLRQRALKVVSYIPILDNSQDCRLDSRGICD